MVAACSDEKGTFMKGLSLLDDSTVNHDAFSAMVRVTRRIHFVMLVQLVAITSKIQGVQR